MHRNRRLVLRLPFLDVAITVRRSRRGRAMFWYVLASALFHILTVATVIGLVARSVFAPEPSPSPEIVSISNAVRIEHRTHPVPAHNPIPRPVHPAAQPAREAVREQPREVAQRRPVDKPPAQRPELSKVAYTRTYTHPSSSLTTQEIQAQTQAFAQTIAAARAANNPVAGAANDQIAPAAPKHYTLNITGDQGRPQPEGILYPLKRWTQGAYVFYYVRYLAQYADGTSETGIVPWPISFPINADPFAHGQHRMPLPGPMSDFVAGADVEMKPLVKNCYDHRYEYCPIAHE